MTQTPVRVFTGVVFFVLKTDNYQQIAKGPFGMSSLWMGEDHLVYVKGSGFLLPFTERYSRYRYQDIQYLAVTQTNRAGAMVLYLLGFLIFGGIVAGVISSVTGGVGLGAIIWIAILSAISLFFLMMLLRHQLMGPTCHCDLKTNLKRERLEPLNRLHLANHAVERLGEVVERKQESLYESEPVAETPEVAFSNKHFAIAKSVMPAFFDFFALGIVVAVALHFESITLWAAAVALSVLGSVMLVVAIARSYKLNSPDSIRRTLLGLLGFAMLLGGVALVYFYQVVSADPSFVSRLIRPFEAFAGVSKLGGVPYYIAFMIATVGVALTSLVGLIQNFKWQSKIKHG